MESAGEQLLAAIEANDKEQLQSALDNSHLLTVNFIDCPPDDDITVSRGCRTPLLAAIDRNLPDFVAELLQRGAFTDYNDPLHASIFHDCFECFELLLTYGATVEGKQQMTGFTPLHAVAVASDGKSSLKIAEILLQNDADVNAVDDEDRTPIFYLKKNDATARFLLENHPQINHQDKHGLTALHVAVGNGQVEVVELLLQHGAKANIHDNHNRVPLMFLVGFGKRLMTRRNYDKDKLTMASIADLLLNHGADPTISAEFGDIKHLVNELVVKYPSNNDFKATLRLLLNWPKTPN